MVVTPAVLSSAVALLTAAASLAPASQPSSPAAPGSEPRAASDRFYVPDDVSPQTAAALKRFYALQAGQPPASKPVDLADYDARNARASAGAQALSDAVIAKLQAKVSEERIGGIPVVRVTPVDLDRSLAPLVHIHGGGWVTLSARSNAAIPALLGTATHREVISIDYTLAPRAHFQQATDEVVRVWKGLLAQGYNPAAMGVFGESAGGNLTLAATLKMRDEGLPLPGALYVMSPSVDLTFSGETVKTLGAQDSGLKVAQLPWLREAYVGDGDPRNPYASPLFGDYSKPFPPTLIQGGTRELLLSDFVREYQAIEGGGHEARLDLYEGMPHVFQAVLVGTPESKTAIARAAAFLNAHLGGPQRSATASAPTAQAPG